MQKDWQKTVNLREQMDKDRSALLVKKNADKPSPEPSQKPLAKPKSRARKLPRQNVQAIDQVYNGQDEKIEPKQDLRTITRPVVRQVNEPFFKRVVIVAAVIIVGLVVYALFFHGNKDKETGLEIANAREWYSIKLINEEIYYGQVGDTTSDPVVVNNVYYDYDQLKSESEEKKEGNNLRLIKRGQETHGPDGTMNIIRAQVIYMEPLKEESKVLRAILDHEQ